MSARYIFPFTEPYGGTPVHIRSESTSATVTLQSVGGATASQPPKRVQYAIATATTGRGDVTALRGAAIHDPERYDVAARVQVTVGNDEANAELWLTCGEVGPRTDPTENGAAIILTMDGEMQAGHVVAGSYTTVISASSATITADRAGGFLWLRAVRTPTAFAVYFAVGDDEGLPDAWTCFGVSDDETLLDASRGRQLRVTARTTAGVTGGFTARWLDTAVLDRNAPTPLAPAPGETW
jgi:hypothetical protein